jgi:hypothetical protein
MPTDPEQLDEVRDPIAEDETEVVETGDESRRAEGEEMATADDSKVDESRETAEQPADDEITISEAEGEESDT